MYNPDIHHRSPIRLKDHDYTIGRYFITIDVNGKMPLFGTIHDKHMLKNDAAEMVEQIWLNTVLRFPGVVLDSFIVMPDHFHGIIDLGDWNTQTPGLGEIIGAFKSQTTHKYITGVRECHWTGFESKLWQRNYFECIIHNPAELHAYREYIKSNPAEAILLPDYMILERDRMYGKMRSIVVVPYDFRWEDEFITLKSMFEEFLGDLILGIEHIGSTAVEGLAAKPVIDLVAVIESRDTLPAVIDRLAGYGFEHEGDLGIEGREAFRRTHDDGHMPYHFYVCAKDNRALREQLAFRDYLRTHDDARDAYGALKMKNAELYRHDIEGYILAKTGFVQEILVKADIINF